MVIFIIIAVAMVAWFVFSRKKKIERINNGELDNVINEIIGYYDLLRREAYGNAMGLISVGTYFFENDGKADSSSAYLAVALSDKNGKFTALAQRLGMKINKFSDDNRYWYQFPIKTPFSTSEKKAVINRVSAKLSVQYPNDILEIDGGMLMSTINAKDTLEMINSAMK